MSYKTTLEHAIRAAAEGAISVGGSWRRLPLAPYLPAGRAVREILAEAEIIIAERDAFEAEVERLRAAIKMAYQCLQRHDYEEAEAALLGTVPDEPAAVINQEVKPGERKA